MDSQSRSCSAAWPHALRPSFSVTRTRAKASVASVSVTAPKRKGRRRRTSRSRRRGALSARASPARLGPDITVVHELDLAPDHVAVLGVLHRRALEVQVLGIDRLVVHDLVELRAKVLHPIVPLRARAVVAQRFDVDDAAHVRRAGAVVLLADDPALVVVNDTATAEGVDGRVLLGEQVVGAHVRRHDVHVVGERARLWISKISLPVAGCGYDAR